MLQIFTNNYILLYNEINDRPSFQGAVYLVFKSVIQ